LDLFNLFLSLQRNPFSLNPLFLCQYCLLLLLLVKEALLIRVLGLVSLEQGLLFVLGHRHLLLVHQLLHHLRCCLIWILAGLSGLVLHLVVAHQLLLLSDEVVVVANRLFIELLLLLSHR